MVIGGNRIKKIKTNIVLKLRLRKMWAKIRNPMTIHQNKYSPMPKGFKIEQTAPSIPGDVGASKVKIISTP
jgi:hypothetical protein